RDENYPDVDEDRVIPHKVETSFYEVLLDQLGLLNLDERQKRIAEQIVGSIDEDGYLRRETTAIVDDLAFRQNIDATEEEVDFIMKSTSSSVASIFCRKARSSTIAVVSLRR